MNSYFTLSCRALLLTGLLVGVSACKTNDAGGETGFIRDRSGDYIKGYSIAPLKMPPGMEQEKPDPYYTIPNLEKKEPTSVSMVPPRIQE